MLLQVQSRRDARGDTEPVAFMLGDKRIEVVEIIDRWISSDHSYFKIHASDHSIYILKFEPLNEQWQLTLFQAHP